MVVRRKLILKAILFVAPVALVLTSLPPAVADGGGAGASLTITPDEHYVGGQALEWTGNIGLSGARTITMQKYLGRDGDEWAAVLYFSSETDSDGNFAFWYPAPGMRNVQYRVVSGTDKTPSVTLLALQQDLTLWVTGDDPDDPEDPNRPVAGQPFGVSVDTTPTLFRSGLTKGLQPIPGRELTLQKLTPGTGDEWVTLGATKVDKNGMGYFTGLTEDDPGDVVYRVRQEDWFKKHNKIGWHPSFPTYITVGASATAAGPATGPATTPGVDEAAIDASPRSPGDTASQRYGWGPKYFDFAWVQGESLTSPPYRGTRLKGRWLDYTDGGGLLLDSKRRNDVGPGDFGTTKVTLQKNRIKFGRWETKLFATADEDDAADYVARIEVVPDGAPDDQCHTITVASYTAHDDTVHFGVTAEKKQWVGSVELPAARTNAFAVEVARDHITWYMNGDPIGTVTAKEALPRVPLTLRLSMVGAADGTEMNRTRTKSDWQRGFSIKRGEQVRSGSALTEQSLEQC